MKWVAPSIVLGALTVTMPAPHGPEVAPSAGGSTAPPTIVEAPESFGVPVREVGRGTLSVFVPKSCIVANDYDLVLHFHGTPQVLGRALSESGVSAVVAVENLGQISGDYGGPYAYGGLLEDTLRRVGELVERACPGPRYRLRRLALSAWSAGYAAVGAVLAEPKLAARVDAVLLSDGLHTALLDLKTRQLPPNALAPFVTFAREAAAGRRFMAITHSSIETRPYASTTESTSYLLAEVGVERVVDVPQVPFAGMLRESHAERGNLTVEGYAGGDEAAHAQQLFAIPETLFARLERYWMRTVAPATGEPRAPSTPLTVTVEVKGDELCTQVGPHEECRTGR